MTTAEHGVKNRFTELYQLVEGQTDWAEQIVMAMMWALGTEPEDEGRYKNRVARDAALIEQRREVYLNDEYYEAIRDRLKNPHSQVHSDKLS